MRSAFVIALCLAAPAAVSAQGGIPVSLFAASHQGNGSQASVLVGVEVDGLTDDVEIAYDVIGSPVPIPGRHLTVAGRDSSARVVTRHALLPGTYRLRVAVTERATGRTGFATEDIEVPDLTAGLVRLAISDAVLTSSAVEGVTHADGDEDRALPVLGQPATARRTFSRREKLEVHAEFYEQPPDLEFDAQLSIMTRVLAADGRVVFETRDTGSSEPLTGNRWGYEHSTLVPIGSFEPGDYVVQIIGETLYDATPVAASRSISITLIP